LHVELLPKLNYHIHKSSFTEGLVQQTLNPMWAFST
jgi:hypothetical protein